MTLGELRDKLAELSDENELDKEVWINIHGGFSKRINDVFVDSESDLVIKCN